MRTQSAACTDIGQRHTNEDAYCADPHLGLFAVADGMGGYAGGEVASRLAIEAVAASLRRALAAPDAAAEHEEAAVGHAVGAANAAIAHHATGRLAGMGSTLAAVVVRRERAVIAHVGDSRVYRLRDGALAQLTRDHSLLCEMREAGLGAVPDEALAAYAHVVTRALGVRGNARPDVRTEPLRPGDVFLVCSDGLYAPLDDALIAQALAALAPAPAAAALVRAAVERGASDNATAVVVRIAGRP